MKKISILLILSLVLFASVEKECISSFFHAHKKIDNTANEARSNNSINTHIDFAEEDVTVFTDRLLFAPPSILSEKVLKSESFFIMNVCTPIWQPPKLS